MQAWNAEILGIIAGVPYFSINLWICIRAGYWAGTKLRLPTIRMRADVFFQQWTRAKVLKGIRRICHYDIL